MTSTTSRASLPLGLLASIAFLASAGARVVDPLLAAIAADFGRSVPTVALVISAFAVPYGLSQLLLGRICARTGRVRVLVRALALYALFTGACALAGDVGGLAILRGLAGAASAGLIPVALAYIAEQLPYAERPAALGQFLNGVVLAQVLAVPIAGLLADHIGWRAMFVGLAVLAAATAAALITRMRTMADTPPRFNEAGGSLRALLRAPGSGQLLLIAAMNGALLGGCFPYIAPFLHREFGLDYFPAAMILAAFGLGTLAYLRIVRSAISALGEVGMVLAGGNLLVLGTLLAAVAGAWPLFIIVQVLLGLGSLIFGAALQVRATEILPDSPSSAIGAFTFMLFAGQAAGTAAMGRLVSVLGYPAAFGVQALCIVASTLWSAMYLRHSARAAP